MIINCLCQNLPKYFPSEVDKKCEIPSFITPRNLAIILLQVLNTVFLIYTTSSVVAAPAGPIYLASPKAKIG